MKLNIEYLKPEELKDYENNPRFNDDAVEKVADSMKMFGFNVPVLIDGDGVIVAGHTRKRAAELLGLKKVPCIRLDDLNDEQIRQYRIVDNKTQELAGWNIGKLELELSAIDEIDMSVFDFAEFDEKASEKVSAEEVDYTSNLDEGVELDISDFDDETFGKECPYCGFKWND